MGKVMKKTRRKYLETGPIKMHFIRGYTETYF